MAPSVWKFVDRPETGATTLLDMRGAGWRVSREGFDVSPPPLRRSIAQNALTDGGVVTAASYDLRELKFTLELSGSTEDARNAQLKALEAELAKPANLLMYQAEGSSFPVFFRTVRSDAFDLDNQFIPGVVWKVPLTVLAEPFAIGTRHDIVDGTVIQNNPASGANPMLFDITGVRGDSPAPAFVRVGSTLGAGSVFTLAQRTANNPTVLTLYTQAETATLSADTTGNGHDPAMSGTGLEPGAASPLTNSQFETDVAAWTATGGTLTRDTTVKQSGLASAKLTSNTGTTGERSAASNSFSVTVGTAYTAGAYLRSGAAFTGGRVNIRWFNAAGSTISTSTGSTATLSTTWQQATITATAPALAVTAHVRVEFTPDPGATAANAYFDNVSVTPGSNHVRTAFIDNNLVARVTVTLPTATSAEALRGRYRVFVKVRRSGSTSAYTMRYNLPGSTSIFGPQVSYDTGLPNLWAVDLGVLEFPVFATPPALGYSGLPAGHVAPTIEIQAQRTSGSLPLDIDYVYLVPADERLCAFRQPITTGFVVLDGPNDMVYGMASGSDPFSASVASRTVNNGGGFISRHGGLPMLVPGVTNRWHVSRPNADVALTSTWSVSYWPRWREVATS